MTWKNRKDIKTRAFEKESIRLAEIAKEREWNSFLGGRNEWKNTRKLMKKFKKKTKKNIREKTSKGEKRTFTKRKKIF